MMKTIALMAVLFLLVGGLTFPLPAQAEQAQAEVAADDPVLATVYGEGIRKSEVLAVIPMLQETAEQEMAVSQALDFVIQQRLLARKISELGMDVFTPEEEATFAAEAKTQWDNGINSYVEYYLAEDTEAAKEELVKKAEAFYGEQGFSEETLKNNLRQRAAIDRMNAHLMQGYEPTEDEVQATFQQFGAAYQQNYENNVMAFEYNTIYNRQASWYTPEGYRGIIHILLMPEDELMSNYTRLRSALEEQQSQQGGEQAEEHAEQPAEGAEATEEAAPAATAEPVTQEMVDQARQAILDSLKEQIDSINTRLNAGESFESLIAELGKDPGMEAEDNLKNGYMVHKESVVWDPVFTQAAFSDKMQKVGDVSDPVVGSNGVHILKYHRDVPSGLHMTDDIREDIMEYLKVVKQNEVFTKALEEWKAEANVTIDEEALAALQPAATEVEPAPQEEPLQAAPEAEGEGETEQTPAELAETVAP